MTTTEQSQLANVAAAIFNAVERHAPAIARDVAQSLVGVDMQIIDRAIDVDWPANVDRADDSGRPYVEPYIAIYRAMRQEFGLPVEC